MTIRPAVIVCYPTHMDYPLFRMRMKQWNKYFQCLYIALTNHNVEESYRQFLMDDLLFATFFDPVLEGKDWRNEAINAVLDAAKHNTQITHYLFLEQDFLIESKSFWDTVLSCDCDFVYYDEDDRIHPAFAVVKKELVEQTDCNFSAEPPVYDHFGRFFFQVFEKAKKKKELREFGFEKRKDFYHMAGLTQNYHCFKNAQPFYKPNEFLAYNYLSSQLPFQNSEFYKLEEGISNSFGKGDHKRGFLHKFFL